MDKDNEIELVQTIQEKDKKIKELETINENITRELLARTEKLSEVVEKLKDSVPKDKIREKIEELDEQQKEWLEDRKLKNSDGEIIFARDVLKELLGEE